jgi:hypothetical protein
MAFPVVASSNSTGGTNANSGVAQNMPSGITAGDLLIAFAANDENDTLSASGWTSITNKLVSGFNVRLTVFAKIATGGDTMTLVSNGFNDYATVIARITGHAVSDVTADILKGTAAEGTSGGPTPPSVTISSTKDWLFLECFGADDDDDTATYWSTNYTGIAQKQSASSTSSCLVAAAYRQLNTGSNEAPGAMAMAASEEWAAQTFAIPPSASTGAGWWGGSNW